MAATRPLTLDEMNISLVIQPHHRSVRDLAENLVPPAGTESSLKEMLRATGPLHVPYTLRIPCKHLSYAPEPVTLSCTCTLVQVTSLNLDYLTLSLSPVSFYFSHARNMNP